MTRLKYLFFTSLLMLASTTGWTQSLGNVEIIADSRVADLVDAHILFNQRSQTIPGFRVMIAAMSGNNSKSAAFRVKNSFLSNNENIDAYLSFEEPNFKVKVGDFKTRLEAFCFLQKVKSTYNNAFIIKDNIYPFKLKATDLSTEKENEDLE